MPFKVILLFFGSFAFAMNMGASNIVPAFAPLFGSRLIKFSKAALLFTLFIILGAVLGGHKVAGTLSNGIIAKEFINLDVTLAIILAAVSGLVIANILRVPESTSWTTVFAITGAGLALNKLNYAGLLKILPFWIILPALSFSVTYFLYKLIYPPRHKNLKIYQLIFNHEKKLRFLVLATGCYITFAAGTNNVPNIVGPLAAAGLLDVNLGLFLGALFFGLGGFLVGRRLIGTVSREIVPLGLVSSSLVGVVTATLLLIASSFGIPQSLVQLGALSVIAVGAVKHERHLFKEKTVRKIFFTWTITPLISFSMGFLLMKLLVR